MLHEKLLPLNTKTRDHIKILIQGLRKLPMKKYHIHTPHLRLRSQHVLSEGRQITASTEMLISPYPPLTLVPIPLSA